MLQRMQPNLERIPGDRDPAAEAILNRAPDMIDQQFLGSLDREAVVALARYGKRQVTTALREHSAALLHQALLATAISACLLNDDNRDIMVGLALPWVVAQRLALPPADVFAQVARRITNPAVANLLTIFGGRRDITLKAFAWQEVATDQGPDFRPLMVTRPGGPGSRPAQR
jgi:hypothetical protein